jgi:hypothetical protein
MPAKIQVVGAGELPYFQSRASSPHYKLKKTGCSRCGAPSSYINDNYFYLVLADFHNSDKLPSEELKVDRNRHMPHWGNG